MKKSILFIGNPKAQISLYKKLVKEKYAVVLFNAAKDQPSDLLNRIGQLTDEDKKRTILFIGEMIDDFDHKEMAHVLINLIELGEFCLIIGTKNAGQIHEALKARTTTVVNENIVVKILHHYHEYMSE